MSKNQVKNSKKANKTKVEKDDKFFSDEHFEKINNPFVEMMKQEFPKQIALIAIMVVLVIFTFMNINKIIAFFYKLIDILSPIIIGWVITFIMAPLYNIVVKKTSKHENKEIAKFSKIIATIVCALTVLAITVGLIFLFVPQLYNSISRFLSRAGGYLSGARTTIEGFRARSNNDVTQQILQQIEKSISGTADSAGSINYSAIASGVFTGFAVSLNAIINYFVAFVVMIYSLNMKEELCYGFKRILFALTRKDIGNKVLVEARYAKQVFTGFFVGKLLDSLIIGILCYVCCLIMKMPYTPLISVIVGITNIIPFFGPFIGAIPAFTLILLEEPFSWKPYGFLIFILILQQIDGNIIGPKILGDKTGVGSFWVLFSILLFGGLFGFIGMIIAVPLWAVITRIFDEFVTLKLTQKGYPTSTSEYIQVKKRNSKK